MVWKIRSEWLKGKMCSSPLKINSPPHPTPILIFLKVYIYKDSDEIFNFSETSRTHLTLIVVLAEITDVFLQFNLGEKIIWGILCSTSPIVVYFCLLLPICLLIKCKIKYACVAKKKKFWTGSPFPSNVHKMLTAKSGIQKLFVLSLSFPHEGKKSASNFKSRYLRMKINILVAILQKLLLLSHFSHVHLYATLWAAACQALLSMGFSRQEY